MTISVRNAGAFATATPSVRDAGVWKALTNGYSKVAGVWVEWFTAFTVGLNNLTFERSDGGSPAEYHISSGGSVFTRTSSTLANRGAWIANTADVGLYEARATLISNTFQSGSVGVWENLSTTRIWTRGAALNASQTVVFTIEIRRASDGVVLTSAQISMGCDRT